MNEFEIIDHYFKDLTVGDNRVICGIGDDAAIMDPPAGRELVVTVDTLVSGVHFFSDTDPVALGFKSLAVNLSDLAAMGATPEWATLSLTLPQHDAGWLEGFAKGFAELAKRYSICLVGGDLTSGPLSITVQAMGTCERGAALKRSGAGSGDEIYISGYPGEAGYALQVLKGGIRENSCPGGHCLERLLKPSPRVELGQMIRGTASAAVDVSDGLAADLGHILTASAAGAVIELDLIPLRPPLTGIDSRDRAIELLLSSGDDYELCFTVPADRRHKIEELTGSLDFPVTRIGNIVDGSELKFIRGDGSEYVLPKSGYKHF